MSLFAPPYMTIQDEDGNPVSGGKLFFYATETSTPASVYADGGLTTPLTNPVVADSAGRCAPVYLDPAVTYRCKVTTAAGATIKDVDPIDNPLATLAASSGSADIGFIQAGTGAVARTAQSKMRDTVTSADFGAVGDGSTNNDTAFTAMRDWLLTRSFAGNSAKIDFLPGRYVSSADLNWAVTRAHLHFNGEVWLINTGAGQGFKLDGGASGDGVYGMKITGKPLIHGWSGGLNGFYARSIFNSELDINVRGAGTTYAGFYGELLVDCDIDYTMSSNEGGLYATPAKGMFLTQRGADLDSSYNRIRAKVSGMATGIYLDAALGNLFHTGSVQNTTTGLETTANGWENKFFGTDFEANTLDVKDASRRLLLEGCDLDAKAQFLSGANGGRIIGGRCESIQVDSGAIGILLDTAYNRTGSGTLVDNGTKTAYERLYNITTETYGKPKAATSLTPATPSYAYTNATSNMQWMTVRGGTVSNIIFSHSGGYYTGATQGIFAVPPGDTITVECTVAPVESVVFS